MYLNLYVLDSVFNAGKKEEVEESVRSYSNLSEEVMDARVEKEIKRVKLQMCSET